ncbi:MAG: hypothetical protein WEC35_03290 [Nitrosopumilaceae archaeon]
MSEELRMIYEIEKFKLIEKEMRIINHDHFKHVCYRIGMISVIPLSRWSSRPSAWGDDVFW